MLTPAPKHLYIIKNKYVKKISGKDFHIWIATKYLFQRHCTKLLSLALVKIYDEKQIVEEFTSVYDYTGIILNGKRGLEKITLSRKQSSYLQPQTGKRERAL